MATDSYFKLLLGKPGAYHFVSSTKNTAAAEENGIQNKISSDQPPFVLQSKINASATAANASHQSKYPECLPGEYCTADLPIGNSEAQQETGTGITRTTNEVPRSLISDQVKCPKKTMKYDRGYMMDYIVRHVGNRVNAQYVKRWNGYSAAHDIMEPSTNIPK